MGIVPVALSSLVSTLTKSDALTTVLDAFRFQGFKTTSWRAGGIGLTTAHYLADLAAQMSSVVEQIARGSLIKYAQGAWLTARADSTYDEQRTAATKTVGVMRLASSDGAPPQTISEYQVWVENGAGLRFVNTTGGTLASGLGETLDLTFEAQYGGAEYNIPTGSSLSLVKPLQGVSVSNPPYSEGDWITSDGSDEQSDASLAEQCVSKWATRSYQSPAGVYEYWAGTVDGVERIYVDDQNPDGPGTLRVYIAGAAGGISDAPTINAVQTLMLEHRSLTASVTTLGTSEQTVVIEGTVYVSGVSLTTAQVNVEAKIAALFSALPIGGVVIGTDPGAVFLDSIIEAVRDADGVVKFSWTAPTSDVAVTATQVAVPDVTGLTYEAA